MQNQISTAAIEELKQRRAQIDALIVSLEQFTVGSEPLLPVTAPLLAPQPPETRQAPVKPKRKPKRGRKTDRAIGETRAKVVAALASAPAEFKAEDLTVDGLDAHGVTYHLKALTKTGDVKVVTAGRPGHPTIFGHKLVRLDGEPKPEVLRAAAPPPDSDSREPESNLDVTPLSAAGIKIGLSLREPFTPTDLRARLDGPAGREYTWLAAWKRKDWLDTVSFGIYKRKGTFGE